MESNYIAVYDVGKTNKKIIIFDENLKIIDSVYHTIDEYVEENIHYENVEKTVQWFKQELKNIAEKYPIKVISVTTHGSAYVCLDSEGNIAVPVIAYTTEPGEEFHKKFYEKFGSVEELQKVTATPFFRNFVNMGKNIYFTKEKYPDKFDKVKHILFFPQFFGYVLTGKASADPTFVGCHSYLWNFIEHKWSSVAEGIGILDKLPEKLSNPWDILGKVTPEIVQQTGLSEDTIVTVGIHDSNSSLLPYLIKVKEEFVLNSTGTWCVSMHPSKEVHFEEEELGKTVFYNLSAFTEPVKTSIFMGGAEFDAYIEILKEINGEQDLPSFNIELYQKIISEKKLFLLPGVVRGTGQFPRSTPRVIEDGKVFELSEVESGENIPEFFKDFNTAYAVLNISLAIQSKVALDMTGAKNGTSIFVEGGFRKNQSYNALLTSLYPDSNISLTNLDEATAFGAAMLGKCALEGSNPYDLKDFFEIEFNRVPSVKLNGFAEYIDSFMKII